MNDQQKEKIEKEVKQVGIDVLVGAVIISLIAGACAGVFFAP